MRSRRFRRRRTRGGGILRARSRDCSALASGMHQRTTAPRAYRAGASLPMAWSIKVRALFLERRKLQLTIAAETIFHSLNLPALSATCTESLTPFLALLPCAAYAGIGELINPYKVFDGVWTEIGVHYSVQGGSHEKGAKGYGERREVRLELGSILDPVRAERLAGGQGRRGESLRFVPVT